MPYLIRIDSESRVGLVVGSGHVTGTELTEACTEMIGRPEWAPGFDEVWDLTSAREIDIGPDELTSLVESTHEVAAKIGANRCVFVHTRDSVAAVLRLFELLTRDLPRTYQTVRSREEAAEWLGVPLGALADPMEDGGPPTGSYRDTP